MTRLLISLIALTFSAGISAGEINGTIKLESKRRLSGVSVTNAVVFYRPDKMATEAKKTVESRDNSQNRKASTQSQRKTTEVTPATTRETISTTASDTASGAVSNTAAQTASHTDSHTASHTASHTKKATLAFPDQPADAEEHQHNMTMDRKAFKPLVLNVNVGTEVNFPNADRVIHNAFSTTKGTEFDLGFYPQGEERSQVFNKAGLVTVYCNVHQNMVGYVLVMDTPYHTRPDKDGTFSLSGLPAGPGKLFIWHPRGRTFTEELVVAEEPTVIAASLRLTKRLVPNHKNKFGKPYRRSRDY